MLCTQIVLFLFLYSEQFMYTTCYVLGIFMYWTGDSMNNLLPYGGLVDAKIRAPDNYLPVIGFHDARTNLKLDWNFFH